MKFRQAEWAEPLIVELDRNGRIGHSLPPSKAEYYNIPEKLRRKSLSLPSLSEPQVVTHYLRLSQMNFGVDSGFYPLGSCTMKYNPKIANRLASNPALSRLHPLQNASSTQGILRIMFELSSMLSEITGMDEFSLAPAAGAQAELAGVLMMRAYHRDRGEFESRDEILIPDSAHGTNPASAAMAGLKVVKIPSSVDGVVELDAVKASISSRTAGMMFTVPNTHGLFEPHVKEIADAVHEKGGLMYYDGANMNALLGRVKPGDLGFDIVHLNLHKTFSTPHGGGGPGSGPVGAKLPVADYLPLPIVTKESGTYGYAENRLKSIGRLRGFHGNVAVLLRAYIYLRALGRQGLRMVSGQAVLAANYLLSLLDRQAYVPSHPESRPVMHEFVCSVKSLRTATGVTASDVVKALLDNGHHAPTVYFPLTVEEALMVEPTETASIEQIEDFAASLNSIAQTARDKPNQLKEAPRNTAIGRLDEVKASHPTTMILTWKNMRSAREFE